MDLQLVRDEDDLLDIRGMHIDRALDDKCEVDRRPVIAERPPFATHAVARSARTPPLRHGAYTRRRSGLAGLEPSAAVFGFRPPIVRWSCPDRPLPRCVVDYRLLRGEFRYVFPGN